MTKTSAVVASFFMAWAWVPAYADSVEEQIEAGVKAYQDKQYQQAVQKLQTAVAQIQDKLNRQYLALLPAPPAGWEAREGEAETAAMALMGGGIHLIREYRRGGETVTVEMRANAPVLAALNAIVNNPDMLAGNPSIQPYTYKGYKGLRKQVEDSVELSLLVGRNTLVQLKGSHLQDERVLQSFLEALDFPAIERMIAS